jgi:Aminoglycoside-2''-adenylyltransferase
LTTFAEVEKVALLLRDLPCEWCVCGGWAVDLFLGRVTRAHKDVDVSVARRDQLEVRRDMNARGWKLEKAHDGKLTLWEDGEFLSPPLHTVWCRSDAHEPDFIEFQLDEIDDERFAFRRDASVTLPRGRISFRTETGVPVLAPEMVLLYKSSAAEEYADDFRNSVGALGAEARSWLKDALAKVYGRHAWAGEL